jgi:hypothetical protein
MTGERMRFQDPGDFDPWKDDDGTALDRFPGPIAVATGPIDSATLAIGLEEIDDEPWAVEAGYRTPARHLLTVRTVRSWKHLDPRGLPVEDLASAVINFKLKEPDWAADPGWPASEAEMRLQAMAQGVRLSRAEIARVRAVPTAVVIDGVETAGSRIDVPGCAAIQLAWGEQTVFCAGLADTVDALRLRTATAADLG